MTRLSGYLLRIFWSEAAGLFAVAGFLLFLFQCLKLFDLVTDKGQNLFSLFGQALLGMPSLAVLLLYVCFGIGLGRALRGLAQSTELAVIHVNRMVPALLRAIFLYILTAAALVLVLAHVIEPLANRTAYDWSVGIGADVVSRSLVPHRFATLSDGVTIDIGSRDAEGNIGNFFADDHRDSSQRRTYFAKTAILTQDEKGFVLRMHDGAMQLFNSTNNQFSQVAFSRYDLPLDNLAGTTPTRDVAGQTPTLDLLLAEPMDTNARATVWRRTAEVFRVFAICLFVAAFNIFPSGRRNARRVPVEVTVLGAAFVERALTSYVPGAAAVPIGIGSVLLVIVATLVLLSKLRVFSFRRARRAAA